MSRSGTQKISLGKALKESVSIKGDRAKELFGLEPGEEVLITSFGKLMKNLIIQLDSNYYLTNKRLVIIVGNNLTSIYFDDIKSAVLKKSNLAQTIYLMSSFKYIEIDFQSQSGEESICFWCSTGVIGGPVMPKNDVTEELFERLEESRKK